jgi:hypothetical protein
LVLKLRAAGVPPAPIPDVRLRDQFPRPGPLAAGDEAGPSSLRRVFMRMLGVATFFAVL